MELLVWAGIVILLLNLFPNPLERLEEKALRELLIGRNRKSFDPIFDMNDRKFSNTVCLCENPECKTKFFRIYQLMERYKMITPLGDDGTPFDELYIANRANVKTFESNGKLLCPSCMGPAKQAIEYEWMKTDQNFPYLDTEGLAARREEYQRGEDLVSEKLDLIEKRLFEREAVEAFQWNYGLDAPVGEVGNDLQTITDEISKQLEMTRANMPYASLIPKVEKLQERLAITGPARFSKPNEEPKGLVLNERQVERKYKEFVRDFREALELIN